MAVEPSGKPHTARNCCSNWLVTQASTVRCPELCGRGANSLIKQLSVAGYEKLDAQHAHYPEPFQHAAGYLYRLVCNIGQYSRRRDGNIQNMPAVLVLDGAIVDELAVLAARRHYRNFALEIDECFEHCFLTPDGVPGLVANSSRDRIRNWPFPS